MAVEVQRLRGRKFPIPEEVKAIIREKINLSSQELRGLEALRSRLKGIGFLRVVDQVSQQIEKMEKDNKRVDRPDSFYPWISPEELKIWQTWLPVTQSFGDFNSSAIPEEVLVEVEESKRMEMFERFEIYKPVSGIRDFVIIGWSENEPFLLLRWGENLISPSKMRDLVQLSQNKRVKIRWIYNIIRILSFAGFIGLPLAAIPKHLNFPVWALSLIIFGVTCIFPGTGRYYQQKWLDKFRSPRPSPA